MSQNHRAPRSGCMRNRLRQWSMLLMVWPVMLAAAPVRMDAAGPNALVAPADQVSVSRLIIRFQPGLHPADGAVINEALRMRLEAAAGRPLGVGTPTRSGDQVLTLTGPVSVTEAKRIVAVLRMQHGVLRVEPDQNEHPRTVAKSATSGDEKPVIRRFIVTFTDPDTVARARANQRLGPEWDDLLTAAAGVPMHVLRPTVGGAWIVETLTAYTTDRAVAIAAQLEATPGIRYAQPDRPAAIQAFFPNDTYFQAGYQPNLANPLTTAFYGIDAPEAWDITKGAGIVVAVVDTGVRPHYELVARLLIGYDFISDPNNSHDSLGRHPDGNDPGDWRTETDCPGQPTAEDSSWHGTHVAGIIGAASNDGEGTAGINWNAVILPVRVLGTCGGNRSDIIEGMQWAAGLPVPGVPNNPYPAQVINMSLGGAGACDDQYQNAIDEVLAQGTFIAVAAGNDSDDIANHAPAGCLGVSTVAATDPYGFLASYSNYSVFVDIAAPGGDQSRYGTRYGIWSTLNTGTTDPEFSTYGAYNGTSQATPHVSAVASLMLSVNPNLTPAQIKSIMADTSSFFATTSTCRTTGACGAGIVNAFYAVQEALRQSSLQSSSVIEFYNAALDHYFISAAPLEISALDTGKFPGWTRTGLSFNAYTLPTAGASPVCRFYIPPPYGDSHYFSASPLECAQVQAKYPQFTYEAPNVFYIDLPDPNTGACPAGDIPVYRLYDNRADTNHRYTTSIAVRNQMLAKGYLPEGYGPQSVAMCAVQ